MPMPPELSQEQLEYLIWGCIAALAVGVVISIALYHTLKDGF